MINPYKYTDPSNPDIELEENPFILENSEKSSIVKKLKGIAPLAPYALNAALSLNQEVRDSEIYQNTMRNRFQQKPIWDYNNMYGDDQPIIKAEKGAKIRTSGSPAMPIEIEGGEFLVLPDGTTEIAKGKSHGKGGIDTILPSGTQVYSKKLKSLTEKKPFAELAKKYDYTNEIDILGNPYSLPVSKTAAERMLARKQKKLLGLFEEQQMLNGDSSGELMQYKKGGKICYECGGKVKYEEGGEYDVDEKEIERLKKLGYKIEIL